MRVSLGSRDVQILQLQPSLGSGQPAEVPRNFIFIGVEPPAFRHPPDFCGLESNCECFRTPHIVSLNITIRGLVSHKFEIVFVIVLHNIEPQCQGQDLDLQAFRQPTKFLWAEEDSNLHGFPHTLLKRARIPFRHPPKNLTGVSTSFTTLAKHYEFYQILTSGSHNSLFMRLPFELVV